MTATNPLDGLELVFVDFETFVDKKAGYDLRKMSLTEYIRDPRFKVHGYGVSHGLEKNIWWAGTEPQITFNLDNLQTDPFALVAHNAKFDASILAWKYGIRPAMYIDTQAMSRAVLGSTVASHSLRNLAEHFGLPEKGEMKTDGLRDLTPEQEAELADYCKHDTWLCREIYKRLAPEFPASQYGPMSWTIKAFVEPQLQINVPLVQKAAEDEARRRQDVFKELNIPKEEFASGPKFAALLESEGFEVPNKTSPRTGESIPALSKTDEGFIALLESDVPRLSRLAEARLVAKSTILETRTAKFTQVGKTGLWPFDVQFSGAMQTHRYSGGNGAGGNPQNLPRGSVLREAIEAPEGKTLVVGDFAAIEARIVAYLAGEKRLTDVYDRNGDVYCDFGSKFYGRTITKKDKAERQFAKVAVLGLGYSMGGQRFSEQAAVQLADLTKVEAGECFKAMEFYRTYYSKVPALWETLNEALAGMALAGFVSSKLHMIDFCHEAVVLPSGLVLRYPELAWRWFESKKPGRRGEYSWSYRGYRAKRKTSEDFKIYGGKLLENISQALAGEITKLAIGRIEQAGYEVVGQCHDEIIVVCGEDEADEVKAVMEQAMAESPEWWTEIQLSAEVGIGKTWASAKP